jgi:hypothetical protein
VSFRDVTQQGGLRSNANRSKSKGGAGVGPLLAVNSMAQSKCFDRNLTHPQAI